MAKTHANRGQSFENLIEHSNNQYRAKKWAIMQKVATPWKILRKGPQIVSAFPEKKSTVDFVGVANGKAIAFDAKSTQNRTSFPLSNVEEHQMLFLQNFHNHGGKAFFLIQFVKHEKVFLIPFTYMRSYWNAAQKGGRKSIPYEDVHQFPEVRSGRGITLDYLIYIDGKEASLPLNQSLWA